MLITCGSLEEGKTYTLARPLAKALVRDGKAVKRLATPDPISKTMKAGQVLRGGF